MDYHALWSAALSVILGVAGFILREKFAEIKEVALELRRVERLLNITREENHRDFITKAEVQRITDHIDQRFNRLEEKIDQLIRQKEWLIVAGIDTFIRGAVGSLAKDKITSQLTPTQMELASFILNPQYYMAEKGINKIAEILGYGSDYRNLSADAKSDKDWYKEVMRDSIGDILPGSIGDFVRATPRNTETDNTPASMYYDPNVGDFVQSLNPIPVNSARFENTVRDMQYGTQVPGQGKFVGALPEDNAIFQSNVSNLPYELNSIPIDGMPQDLDIDRLRSVIYGPAPEVGPQPETGFSPGSGFAAKSGGSGDLSYTEMLDILNSTPSISGSRGLNVSSTESLAPAGSVYDANIGANVPAIESLAPTGYTFDAGSGMNVPEVAAPEGYMFNAGSGMNEYLGGGSKGNIEDYSYSQYRYGGQIHRGRR